MAGGIEADASTSKIFPTHPAKDHQVLGCSKGWRTLSKGAIWAAYLAGAGLCDP
jgi:hypothetical protein